MKIFTENLQNLIGRRFDPRYYSPQYTELDEAMFNCRYDCCEIRDLKIDVFQGVGRNLLEYDGIQLLKVKNILPDGSIDFSDTEPISDVPENKLLRNGDIISPFIGAAIKGYKFGYFERTEREWWTFDNNTGIFRNNDDNVLSKYLWAFFQLELTHRQIDRIIGGGGVPYLGTEYAKTLKVILPPISKQQKIVAELDEAYAAKRAADQRASDLLCSIDDMVMEELGIGKVELKIGSLDERIFITNASQLVGMTLSPAHYYQQIDFGSSKYACLRIGEIAEIDPVISCAEQKTFQFVAMEGVSAERGEVETVEERTGETDGYSVFGNGDVIFAKITPCMENGKSAVVENVQGIAYGSTEFMVFRMRDTRVLPGYLHLILRLRQFREVAACHFTGSAGHQRVDKKFVSQLPIPVPPTSVQDRIVRKSMAMKAEAKKLKAEAAAKLESAKRRIESELMEVSEARKEN